MGPGSFLCGLPLLTLSIWLTAAEVELVVGSLLLVGNGEESHAFLGRPQVDT